MQQVTGKDAYRMLKRVVRERGKAYVYEAPAHMGAFDNSCLYVHKYSENGPLLPGCGVALAITHFGIPLERLQQFEGHAAGRIHEWFTTPVGFTKEAADVFHAFQSMQDVKQTYKEALRAARAVYKGKRTVASVQNEACNYAMGHDA